MSPRPQKLIGITCDPSGKHQRRPWRAQIHHGQQVLIWPPRFARAADAARLYDVMALCLRGAAARINFDGQPPAGVLLCDVEAFLAEKGALPKAYQRGKVLQVLGRTPLI